MECFSEARKVRNKNHQTVNAKAGDDVNLSCSAIAHPKPFMTWSKEVEIVNEKYRLNSFYIFLE